MADLFSSVILSRSVWSIVAAYLAGFLASFSPCIYPLIPITLGIIGAYSVHSHRKGFFLSFMFVLGVAFIYTALGVISSLFGVFMGTLMVNPVSYSLIGLMLLLLGLSLWEIIHVKFHVLAVHLTRKRSLFIVGIVSGFAALPCIFPILGTILGLISMEQDIFYGGIMLFSFSLGYGTILLILGTFSSLISRLPKSGKWLIIINRCIGTFLLILSVYFFVKALRLVLP